MCIYKFLIVTYPLVMHMWYFYSIGRDGMVFVGGWEFRVEKEIR